MGLAERFFQRFAGLERAHGRTSYQNGNGNGHGHKDGKVPAACETVHEPTTIDLWEAHLEGLYGLGIIPIRDDATCTFGAIDIDNYDPRQNEKLLAQATAMQMPVVVCRTKSGGSHIFLFLTEPAPAELVRGKLMEWSIALGHSGAEVFPKQTRLAGPNDAGSYINMPYYMGMDGKRFAIAPGGKDLDPEEFLAWAGEQAISVQQLQDFAIVTDEEMGAWWADAPPCLQSLAAAGGFGQGSRNNALFNVAVYLRKRHGDDFWADKLDAYNQKFMDPPLGHKEVAATVRSVGKKAYEYKCRDEPIVRVCNRQICLSRKCGVGAGENDPGVALGRLVKVALEPPIWIWDVDGARMELTTAELKDQGRFQARAMEVVNKLPMTVKPKRWAEIIRENLLNVEVIPAPPDASVNGQVWSMLERYCTGRTKARKREELLLNKPWTGPYQESHPIYTWFSATHFRGFLEQNRVRLKKEGDLWLILQERGAVHQFFNIKGRGINCWGVPPFAEQTEGFETPEMENENI